MLSRRRLFGLAAVAPVAAVLPAVASPAAPVEIDFAPVTKALQELIAVQRAGIMSANEVRTFWGTGDGLKAAAENYRLKDLARTARAIPVTERAVSSDDGVGADGAAGCGVEIVPQICSGASVADYEFAKPQNHLLAALPRVSRSVMMLRGSMPPNMEPQMTKRVEKPAMGADEICLTCRHGIAVAAGPRTWTDTRESWLARAARKLGLPHRRVRGIWYGEARTISAQEYLRITAEVEAMEAAAEAEREAMDAIEVLAGHRASRVARPAVRESAGAASGGANRAAPAVSVAQAGRGPQGRRQGRSAMSARKTNAGGIAAERLKQFVHAVERLIEERQAAARAITEKFQEIRGAGFDVKIVRQIVKLRATDSAERDEAEHLLDVYKQALDMDHNGGDEVRRAAALFRQGATIDGVASMMDVSRSHAGRLRQACVVMGYIEGEPGEIPTKNRAAENVGTGRKDIVDQARKPLPPHNEETGEIHEDPAPAGGGPDRAAGSAAAFVTPSDDDEGMDSVVTNSESPAADPWAERAEASEPSTDDAAAAGASSYSESVCSTADAEVGRNEPTPSAPAPSAGDVSRDTVRRFPNGVVQEDLTAPGFLRRNRERAIEAAVAAE